LIARLRPWGARDLDVVLGLGALVRNGRVGRWRVSLVALVMAVAAVVVCSVFLVLHQLLPHRRPPPGGSCGTLAPARNPARNQLERRPMSEDNGAMNREQAEAFAQGLYHLASVDGIDAREVQLIRDFLVETGHPDLVGQLGTGTFDLGKPARVITTTFLRRVFLRTAIALVKADGNISESEGSALRDAAERLGLMADLEELLAEPVGRIET
jgi:hypothetical protein